MYAKVRMQLNKEYEEELDEEDEVEMTEDEKTKIEEITAMSRQTFDPVEKIYDDCKRRATDLKECSHVTLPKPAKLQDEANLEMRRNAQVRAYNEYRVDNIINEKVEQQPNLTSEEQDGLKSLMKKIKDKSIIIMKTDKSSRFVVTDEENYIRMGSEHTRKDTLITRREVSYNEKVLNSHCTEWGKIFNSGKNLGQLSRIITSKKTSYIRTIRRSRTRPGKGAPATPWGCPTTCRTCWRPWPTVSPSLTR